MALNFLGRLAKRLNRVTSGLKEKPTVAIEDFVLEHFLLYHGLVGSSPDNQRDFKDLRADMLQAVRNGSSFEMGVALKVPPLWWEDKLKRIVDEIKDSDRQRLIETLLPDNPDGMLPPNQNPLLSDDWRVRSNAATLLGYLKEKEAAERMIEALDDTDDSIKASFCHVAYGLSSLGTEECRKALESYLFAEESWFRVDAAGALAHFNFAAVSEALASALTSPNTLSDYVSVAVAKHHPPSQFLSHHKKEVQDGGCGMILALIDASGQTFSLEAIEPFFVHTQLDRVCALAREVPSALRLKTVLSLAEFIKGKRDLLDEGSLPSRKAISSVENEFRSQPFETTIRERINNHRFQESESEPFHDLEGLMLIELIGEFKLSSEFANLHKFLDPHSHYLNAAVDALGAAGDTAAAKFLIRLASQIVDQQKRSSQALSSQPVVEKEPEHAQTYWRLLRALGNIPAPDAAGFLFQSAEDYAPDKRQQAIASLVSLSQMVRLSEEEKKRLDALLSQSLRDPSAQVRLTGLEGIGEVGEANHVSDVVAQIDAKEVSLSRQAFKALSLLASRGMGSEVVDALKRKISTTGDARKRQRIQDFIDGI